MYVYQIWKYNRFYPYFKNNEKKYNYNIDK
jgi:hypothetical protein